MTTKLFNRPAQINYRRKLRKDMNKGESLVWSKLRNSQLGVRFCRQYSIGPFIVDFYCPSKKIVVEIDGLTHADEKVFEYDQRRQSYLEKLGISVKRYNSDEVFNNLDNVLFDLFHYINDGR